MKPEWKLEIGSITITNQDAYNIMCDRHVATEQCSMLGVDINNLDGKYKSSISPYDEIKLNVRYSGDSWVQEFGGQVDKISYRKSMQGDIMHLDCRSYEQKFFFKNINKSYRFTYVEDIIKDIISDVNDNIATNFTTTGVGSPYGQESSDGDTQEIRYNTDGQYTVGQTILLDDGTHGYDKQNVIVVGVRAIRKGEPSNLTCKLYKWDTDYATTTSGTILATDSHSYDTVIEGSSTTQGCEKIFILDAVGLSDGTYLLDFSTPVIHSSDKWYKLACNSGGGLANVSLYEGTNIQAGEDLFIKINPFTIEFRDKSAFAAMRELCERLGYDWYSAFDKNITLIQRNVTASKTIVTGKDIIGINFERNITQLSNKITVQGSEYNIVYPETTDEYTEPENQTWVDNNWKYVKHSVNGATGSICLNAGDGTSTVGMIDEGGEQMAGYGTKYVELHCVDHSEDDGLRYPKTESGVGDGIVGNDYKVLGFGLRAADIDNSTPLKVRIVVHTHTAVHNDGAPDTELPDCFYQDLMVDHTVWKLFKLRLPNIESNYDWVGVSDIGRRWDYIKYIGWCARTRDSGSVFTMGAGFDSDKIYGIYTGVSNTIGQRFVADDRKIIHIATHIKKVSSPAHDLCFKIKKWDTDYATTVAGSTLQSVCISKDSITTSYQTFRSTFDFTSALEEGEEYLIHIGTGANCDISNYYVLEYNSSTNDNGDYHNDGVESTGNSIYFVLEYEGRHATSIGVDALYFVGSDMVEVTVEDTTSEGNYDTREYIIRKDDINSTEEATQKAKQTLRLLGYGDDTWTGSPGDTKDIQNSGYVNVVGRNDLKPGDSIKVQYSEGNLDCDFRIDSITQNLNKMSGWVTTLRLAMILPQMTVAELLQHVLVHVDDASKRVIIK